MNKQLVAKEQLKKDELEFQQSFSVLKERIYALNEEVKDEQTKESLASILDSIHYAVDTLEEVVLTKAEMAEGIGDLMDAIDDDIVQQGFFRGEYPETEAKVRTAQHLEIAVSYLVERVEQLAKRSGLEPLYLAEKVHEAFDDIHDETVSAIELGKLERGEITATSWEDVRKKLV